MSLRTSKGVLYLAYLVRHPEERVHSSVLAQLNDAESPLSPIDESADGDAVAMERARKAVTNRIRESIARIAKQHPALGRHLANGIQTGLHCVYRPEAKIVWTA